MHPFKAFAASQPLDKNAWHGCYCALEGAPQAIQALSPLLTALKASIIPLKPKQKTKYHAAAVIASNYLITLAATGTKLLQEAGIEATTAKLLIQQLMQSSLNAFEKAKTPEEALTGPLARGDINTIKHHLATLEETHIRDFYCAAALTTLPLTTLNAKQQETITTLLNNQARDIL